MDKHREPRFVAAMITTAPTPADPVTLYYAAEGFDTGRDRLMGRHAASEGFLRALGLYMTAPSLDLCTSHSGHAKAVAKRFEDWGRSRTVNAVAWEDADSIGRQKLLMRPDPHVPMAAWQRRRARTARYALCGVTHTISSENALEALSDLVWAPVERHDALICTSQAVYDSVTALLDHVENYAIERFGGRPVQRPMLPVIPLGIHTQDFARNEAWRSEYRQRAGAAEGECLVLWFGRLSFHAKAHPAPLFRALQRATETHSVKLRLALAGWFAGAAQEKAFREGAATLCPDVPLVEFDGRDPDVRQKLWSAADLFAMPVDNIQETFGLAPVEAMAAGVPPIISDWDGFKDTVIDGETGVRVPSLTPPPPAGSDLMAAHAAGVLDYDRYLAAASQSCVVDWEAMGQAIGELASQPERRAEMAQRGVAHARQTLDWSVIIPQYEALWAEQRAVLDAAPQTAMTDIAWADPRRPDPFAMFGNYPTRMLSSDDQLAQVSPVSRESVGGLAKIPGVAPIPEYLLGMADLLKLTAPLAEGPQSVAYLLAQLGQSDTRPAIRTLMWLIKHGLVRIVV